MLVRLAILALLAAAVAGGKLVFPDSSSSKPAALNMRLDPGGARCPYPLPLGTTLSSLPSGCYDVTDEEDLFVPLNNANDVQCSVNHLRKSDGRCVKVVLRVKQSAPKKGNNGPLGEPNW